MFIFYSRPLALNHYPDILSGRELQVTVGLNLGIFAAYSDATTFRHDLIRVDDQIVNDLANQT